jgi:hypothetical protein
MKGHGNEHASLLSVNQDIFRNLAKVLTPTNGSKLSVTSWDRAMSTNGDGIIPSIGWPSGLNGVAIGYPLNR